VDVPRGGARRHQRQGERQAAAFVYRLTLGVGNIFRMPAAEDEANARNDPALEPCECREQAFEARKKTAADAQVGPVKAQSQTERAGWRVEGVMWNQVRRYPPDPLGPKSIESDHQIRPAHESAGGQQPPAIEAAMVCVVKHREQPGKGGQRCDRLVIGLSQHGGLNWRPSLGQGTGATAKIGDLLSRERAENVSCGLGFEASCCLGRRSTRRALCSIHDHVVNPRHGGRSHSHVGGGRRIASRPRLSARSFASRLMMTIYGFSDILTSPIGDRLPVLAVKTL
jgi:hypothetical protein